MSAPSVRRGRDTCGILTESTLLPRPGTKLEGVDSTSFSALAAAIASSRSTTRGAAPVAPKRPRVADALGPRNAGIDARARIDERAAAAAAAAAMDVSSEASPLHVKALVYELLSASTAAIAADAAARLRGAVIPPTLRAQVQAALEGHASGGCGVGELAAVDWSAKRGSDDAAAIARSWVESAAVINGGAAAATARGGVRAGIGYEGSPVDAAGRVDHAVNTSAPARGVVVAAWERSLSHDQHATLEAVSAETAAGRASIAAARAAAASTAAAAAVAAAPSSAPSVAALLSAALSGDDNALAFLLVGGGDAVSVGVVPTRARKSRFTDA